MGLMCLDKSVKGLIGSIYYAGFALASLFGPRLSDHFGRKAIILPGIVLCLISEALIIFVCRSFNFLIVLMFFYGVSGTCRYSIMYLFMQELTPKKRQPLVGTIIHCVNGFTASMTIIYTKWIYSYWVPY